MSGRLPERRQHPLVGADKSASPNDQSVYVGGQFHFISSPRGTGPIGRSVVVCCPDDMNELLSTQSDRQINKSSGFGPKYLTCLLLFVGRLEDYLVVERSHCCQLNMTISISQ